MRFLRDAYLWSTAASLLGSTEAVSLDYFRNTNFKRALSMEEVQNTVDALHGKAHNSTDKAHPKTAPPKGHLTECHMKKDDPAAPFCLPQENMIWRVGDTYDVTWDVDLVPHNSSVVVHVDYVDVKEDEGTTAFTTEKTDSSYGFVKIKTDKKWLHGNKGGNNLTISMIANAPKAGRRAKTFSGPQITLKKKPKKKKTAFRSAPPSQHDMLIAFPLTMAILMTILIGLFVGMRTHRQINMGGLMRQNRHKKKYMPKKRGSRRDVYAAEEELLKYSDDRVVDEGLSTGTPGAQRQRSRSRNADPRLNGLFAQNQAMKTWTQD